MSRSEREAGERGTSRRGLFVMPSVVTFDRKAVRCTSTSRAVHSGNLRHGESMQLRCYLAGSKGRVMVEAYNRTCRHAGFLLPTRQSDESLSQCNGTGFVLDPPGRIYRLMGPAVPVSR